MNKRVKTHFQYSWWAYILIIVAVITLWVSVFVKLAEPKADERLNITIVGSVDGKNIAADLEKALESKTNKPLKEINVEIIAGDNVQIGEIIAMRCMGETDLIIFEEEYIVKPLSLNFKPVDESRIKEYFGSSDLYKEDDKTYGVLLYDGTSQINFKTYYKGDKKFYAFVTPVSENCAKLNGKGAEESDAAIQAIKYFTEAA